MVVEISLWSIALISVIVLWWIISDHRVKTVCKHVTTYWKNIEHGHEEVDPICGQIVNQVFWFSGKTFLLGSIKKNRIVKIDPYVYRGRQHVHLTVSGPPVAKAIEYFIEATTESKEDEKIILDLIDEFKRRLDSSREFA